MLNLKPPKTTNKETILKNNKVKLVYFASFTIFQYADTKDLVLMSLGFVGCVGDGIAVPTMMLIMIGIFDAFGNASTHALTNNPMLMDEIRKVMIYFVYAGCAVGISCFLEASSWIKTGERQASRLRCLYLKAVLRQDESFFDMQSNTAEIINSIGADSQLIQEVIAEKVPHFIMNLSNFIASYTVGFYMAWKLTITTIAFLPLLVIPGILYGRILTEVVKNMREEYMKAGAVAEKAISSIRTIYSFVGEERTLRLFSNALETTIKLGLKQGLAKGLTVGSNGLVFAIWAFMAWYGNNLVSHHGLNGGNVIATGLVSIIGGLSLGNCLPNLKYFAEASLAGARIMEMINRKPTIDQEACMKKKPNKALDTVVGNLELKNVTFAYPARPDTMIFNGLSLSVHTGKTTALVGGSGSGKSTVIALIQRFYDPLDGEILLDGTNVKLLHLPWLRAQIGLVSQEPALFATTIKHNILLGRQGATMDEIIEAAEKSNAHSFISQLPEGYDTQVGEHGIQMSGGQKQRIAIARALLINPPILLLDEATSALDAESEHIVQDALHQAAVGRTTLLVSHRLSTIQNADIIAVMQKGRIIEIGQHENLMQKDDSAYAELIHASGTKIINSFNLNVNQRLVTNAESTDQSEQKSSRNTRMVNQNSSSSCISRSSSFNGCHSEERFKVETHNSPLPPSFRRLVLLNKPEWRQALIGTVGAAFFGIIQPLFAFTIGGMIVTFYMTDSAEQARRIRKYCLSFVALALASFVTNAIQHYNFAVVGERLMKRVREQMLMNILKFEVAWFDTPENSSGAICTRLASDANSVRSLVGDRWSLIITTFVSIVTATSFGLAIAWRLALVIMACQPLIILCFYSRRVLIKTMSQQALRMQQDSSNLAAEAVVHHRTVAAFCAQPTILKLYVSLQKKSSQASTRQAIIGGLGLGSAQLISFFSLALDYWYGARLVSEGLISSIEMFRTFFILISTGRVIAEAGSMTSDIAKGAAAVDSVFEILDRISNISPDEATGDQPEHLNGDIELHHVDFAYPQRPKVLVFQDFSLHIHAGQSVALVGQSGSGKSTIISLIERFYDPTKGKVMIDGKDVRQYHLRTLRKHIALVSQEPTLFEGSIRENILYSNDVATLEEIVKAAKAANAHDFISALENGYETNVGERGLQLSGGQKQRIAIARAILKKPVILLLDEATSALDVKSEKVVQAALEGMMVGRTTVVVAHRLSTIFNCNTIAVLQGGTIVESGSHAELMTKGDKGIYFNLVKLQHHLNVSPVPPDSLS